MAIDPVTAAKLAKLIADRLKDKESRKKTFITIIAIVTSLLMIIAVGTYILQHPVKFLMDTFGMNEKTVTTMQEKYGEPASDVAVPDTELDYDEIEYDNITMTSGETSVVYYNQGDPAWGKMLYGSFRPISATGCGPTSMAIVISTFQKKIIPPEACRWSAENGYLVQGKNSDGSAYAMSSHALIPGMAKAYGLKCQGVGKDSTAAQKIVKALANGKLVVAIMGPGHFTSGGHFMVLRGVTKQGKILVADCASYDRSKKEWKLDVIIQESRNGAAAGGPFWIISK